MLGVAVVLVVSAGIVVGLLAGGGSDRRASPPMTTTSPSTTRPQPAVASPPSERALTRLAALGFPVYCAGTRQPEFALTFDDGPGLYTPRALRMLRRFHVPATFFLVGKVIVVWPNEPPLELRAGALGDHSWTHPFLPSLSPTQVEQELTRTKMLIERITHHPIHLFRPPYGGLSPAVEATARKLHMVDVLWSIDSRDWAGAKWNQIAANVLREVRPGSIVLMHENRGQTLRALRYVILPHLRQLGVRPVSLPQLFADNPPSLRLLRGGLTACLRTPRRRASG